MYRIYRDTRFSENKTPYKTHVAAVFPPRGLPKHEGAGVYFHVSPDEVWMGGGMYAPQTPQLQAVREHIAGQRQTASRDRRVAGIPPACRPLEGERLQRVPRGFPKDHPAAEYLKYRQFLAGARASADVCHRARSSTARCSTVFRQVVPLARFLTAARCVTQVTRSIAAASGARQPVNT